MEGSATTTNRRRLLSIASLCLLLATPAAPSPPLLPRSSPFLGISPQDEWYYESALIACRDGSKSFSRDRLNDDFCDCVDGTDEPGTSACPESRFYCRNVGNTPQLLFSSRVNDHICDCCDGSDEYDGIVNCPNTCFTARITHQMNESYGTITYGHNINTREGKNRSHLEELVQKLKELKMIVIMEVILLGCVIVFGFSRKRITSRRRQHI